jgi:hypothetical protein
VSSVVLQFPLLRPRALDATVRAVREAQPADAGREADNVVSLRAFAGRRRGSDLQPPSGEAA